MSDSKSVQGRIQLKNDSKTNWDKATGFKPKLGELIIYNDSEGAYLKIGDNKSNAPNLKYVRAFPGSGVHSLQDGSASTSIASKLVGSIVASQLSISLPSATGDLSHAFGCSTTATSIGARSYGVHSHAGYNGFYVTKISGKTITLSKSQSYTSKPTAAKLNTWQIGDTVSIVNEEYYPECAKITAIDTSAGTITVDQLPFNSLVSLGLAPGPHDRSIIAIAPITVESIGISGLYTKDVETVRVVRDGDVDFGFGSVADGFNNISAGPVSAAFGYRNVALATAAFVTGRDNKGGFAALVGGLRNHGLGTESFVVGRDNKALGKQSVAIGKGNTANQDQLFVSGRYAAHPEGATQFLHIVGNGTADSHSNAYSLDEEGNGFFAGEVCDGYGNKLSDCSALKPIANIANEEFLTSSYPVNLYLDKPVHSFDHVQYKDPDTDETYNDITISAHRKYNMIPMKHTGTKSFGGTTVEFRADGSMIVNGECTASSAIILHNEPLELYVPAGTYVVAGVQMRYHTLTDYSNKYFYAFKRTDGGTAVPTSYSNLDYTVQQEYEVTFTEPVIITRFGAYISKGGVFDNVFRCPYFYRKDPGDQYVLDVDLDARSINLLDKKSGVKYALDKDTLYSNYTYTQSASTSTETSGLELVRCTQFSADNTVNPYNYISGVMYGTAEQYRAYPVSGEVLSYSGLGDVLDKLSLTYARQTYSGDIAPIDDIGSDGDIYIQHSGVNNRRVVATLSGTEVPNNSLGMDGDIYIKY